MKKTKVYKNAKAEKAIMESYADLLAMWDTKISELENAERSFRMRTAAKSVNLQKCKVMM